MFDAYKFATELIRLAKRSLVLIDNYVDESVLLMLSKRQAGVTATIYTQQITPQLRLDLNKFNKQYPSVSVRTCTQSHDRFLIIDNTEVYHIGASLKDLGKKWFAFSKLDIQVLALNDAGCTLLFSEKASGRIGGRLELSKCLEHLRLGSFYFY